MSSLEILRQEDEQSRFARLRADDTRTAVPAEDAVALAAELRRRIEGEVRFDPGSRAMYASDSWNYRQVPIGVVNPRTIADVVATVEACRRIGAPVLPRGGGTSLAGQCCNVAVVIDFSKYLRQVLNVDADGRLGTVQPGCVLDDLRDAAARHGLTFGPDPATHSHNVLGGMLGNNSCGIHSLLCAKHGRGLRTSDNTHEMEILTYDGTRMRVGATPPEDIERIIRSGGRRGEIYAQLKTFVDRCADAIRRGFPSLSRRVSGYSLDALLPENGFHVAQSLVGSEGTLVTILEATLNLVPRPAARSLLVLGYPDIYSAGEHVIDILPLNPTGLEGIDHLLFQWIRARGDKAADLVLMPEGGGFLMVEFGGDSKEDSDSQSHRCMDLLRRQNHPPSMTLFDNPEDEEKIWKVRESGLGATAWVPGQPDTWPGWEDSAVAPNKVGEYLHKLRDLFGKYDYPITSNLRIGPDYNPPQPETHFKYPGDRHTFSLAALRCVGVGKCRRESGGVMCPSYMVTREEMHSTRGRARLLFEMLNGEVLEDGWRSDPQFVAAEKTAVMVVKA